MKTQTVCGLKKVPDGVVVDTDIDSNGHSIFDLYWGDIEVVGLRDHSAQAVIDLMRFKAAFEPAILETEEDGGCGCFAAEMRAAK